MAKTPVTTIRLPENLVAAARSALTLPDDTPMSVVVRTALAKVAGSNTDPIYLGGRKKILESKCEHDLGTRYTRGGITVLSRCESCNVGCAGTRTDDGDSSSRVMTCCKCGGENK